MPQISVLDVIIIFDETISPPGPKMVVAIHPENGWYYRINTKPWHPAIRIEKEPEHRFLDHDSHMEAGDPLELDDDLIEQSIRRNGIVGKISNSICPKIKLYLAAAAFLSEADKEAICNLLDEC